MEELNAKVQGLLTKQNVEPMMVYKETSGRRVAHSDKSPRTAYSEDPDEGRKRIRAWSLRTRSGDASGTTARSSPSTFTEADYHRNNCGAL